MTLDHDRRSLLMADDVGNVIWRVTGMRERAIWRARPALPSDTVGVGSRGRAAAPLHPWPRVLTEALAAGGDEAKR